MKAELVLKSELEFLQRRPLLQFRDIINRHEAFRCFKRMRNQPEGEGWHCIQRIS